MMKRIEEKGNEVKGCIMGNPIPWEQIDRFGIIEVDDNGNYRRIVEHPQPGQVNTNLNNSSFYILPDTFFSYLERQISSGRTSQGEYYLIDALNDFVADGQVVAVYQTDAEYLECGSLDNWVRANSWLMEHGLADTANCSEEEGLKT